jgi:hypothetical protein
MDLVPTFPEFLAECPPGEERLVNYVVKDNPTGASAAPVLNQSDIRLECTSSHCGGLRHFQYIGQHYLFNPETQHEIILLYRCRNCRESRKVIAIMFLSPPQGSYACKVRKLGEHPPFGRPIPSRVITLIGPDRDAFLKGWRSESQGLGIGAFSYYRRVIENQKNRLIGEMIRVAKRLNSSPEMVGKLEAAQQETQFSKAIETVKQCIPAELLIRGHNPLALLHGALSEGLHALTDEQCLEVAISIREVLFELAERVGQALKEQAGLDAAVTRLTQKRD